MDFDYGVIIGLIATLCGAGVLGMSYMGAYMLGRVRGRSEVELERRMDLQDDARLGRPHIRTGRRPAQGASSQANPRR